MKNKKKILFIPIGSRINASSRTRVYNYKNFIEKSGFAVTIIPYNSSIDVIFHSMGKRRGIIIKLINKINQLFKCIAYLLIAWRYDVIVVHRILFPKSIFKLFRSCSKRLIFDFDDAIYLADKWHKSFLNKHKFLESFRYILTLSDDVIVSNSILREVALKFNPNVAILPTPIDTQKFIPAPRRDYNKMTLGWIGSPETTRYLEMLKDPLQMLTQRFPFLRIELVGGVDLPDWKNNVFVKRWSLENEIKDVQNFDIGIMPITNDEWSIAKGGYKLLQYMAIGIPCVASPVGINKEIIVEGVTGFLAATPEEWTKKISMLIEDKNLRDRMGAEGRRRAEALYSYQVIAVKLIDILRRNGGGE